MIIVFWGLLGSPFLGNYHITMQQLALVRIQVGDGAPKSILNCLRITLACWPRMALWILPECALCCKAIIAGDCRAYLDAPSCLVSSVR